VRSRGQIDPGLALAIAGQVSIGLTPGDKRAERAHMALVVIGLMVKQASPGDEIVADVLTLAERTRIEASGEGYTIRVPDERAGGSQ
jgi:hypothetical protein